MDRNVEIFMMIEKTLVQSGILVRPIVYFSPGLLFDSVKCHVQVMGPANFHIFKIVAISLFCSLKQGIKNILQTLFLLRRHQIILLW